MTELLNASEVFVGRREDGKAEEIMTAVFLRGEEAHGCREGQTGL